MKHNRDFYGLATLQFVSCLKNEKHGERVYDKLSSHVYDGKKLPDNIIFWEPFENWPAEDVIHEIDGLAEIFKEVYELGLKAK